MPHGRSVESAVPQPIHGDDPIVDAKGVSRNFGPLRALTDVDVSFFRGEVHGLVGANGAGKSTLLNIISGALAPTQGSIHVGGRRVSLLRPADAAVLGLSFIHQELALIPEFSSIENMTLGVKSLTTFGLRSARERAHASAEVADRLGISFDLTRPVRELSVAERGMVAIGRALVRDARFIAMDEPTAALSDVECSRLFTIIRELSSDGVSIAYVSHRLTEIESLSDRVTVFKDGRVSARFERGNYDRLDLIRGITGYEHGLGLRETLAPVPRGADVVAAAIHLGDGGRVKDVSFECHAGEILGLAGVVGAGRSEVLGLFFGDKRPTRGTMRLNGAEFSPANVRQAIFQGVALVPEERRSQALIMDDSIRSNITLGNWRGMRHRRSLPFVSDRQSEVVAQGMLERLRIKAVDTSVAVRKLSGGNQQKVVFGRWLARNSKLLLLDEPTRGVDIGARQQIWQTVEDFAAAGNAVVVVSSELEELSICHRVIVMVEGVSVEEIVGPGVSEEQMLNAIYHHDHTTRGARA